MLHSTSKVFISLESEETLYFTIFSFNHKLLKLQVPLILQFKISLENKLNNIIIRPIDHCHSKII